jgi:hypothetical protein
VANATASQPPRRLVERGARISNPEACADYPVHRERIASRIADGNHGTLDAQA